MCAPSAPPPPDYAGLAKQQGQENRETAIYNNAINRVNQVGPDGSVTWSTRPGFDPNNPQPGDYIQTTSLSPTQQALYDAQGRISQNLAGTAEAGLGRVGQAMATPFDTSGAPALRTVNASGQPVVGSVDPTQLRTGINAQGLPNLSSSANRDQIIQSLMARQNEDIGNQQHDLETRLLQSGIERGTDAWNREMTQLDRRRTDALNQAYTTAGTELSRDAGVNLASRQQLFGEQSAEAGFQNTAAGQQFQQALSSGQFANTSARDAIAQALAAAQQGNQARGQSLQEQAYTRQIPLNELNALRTGSQVSMPNFNANFYTNGASSAPVFDAGMAQGNYNMNAYQQDMAGYNALLGGLSNLGAAWIGG